MPGSHRYHGRLPDSMSSQVWNEQATVFECGGNRLIGIATSPERPIETGVVIIVGGPQYRAGSHRQFTLLARQLAGRGIASFRFDYRGMGDSEGGMHTFEEIGDDIRAAIETFMTQAPSIERIALWGLCDAASAALYYGHTDPRVSQLILLNPWVHTEAGAARARLKHYYFARVLNKAFWSKLISGKVRLGTSIGELKKSARHTGGDKMDCAAPMGDPRHGSPGYIDRMLDGLKQFQGTTRFILSGNDLTAWEFETLLSADASWTRCCSSPKVAIIKIHAANHTFSSRAWRDQVADRTIDWINRSP